MRIFSHLFIIAMVLGLLEGLIYVIFPERSRIQNLRPSKWPWERILEIVMLGRGKFFLLLLLLSFNVHATNYFNWDADATNNVHASLGLWDQVGQPTTGNCTLANAVLDTSDYAPISGNVSSMKITFTDDGPSNHRGCMNDIGFKTDVDPVGGGVLYFRFWMKIPSNFLWGDTAGRGYMKAQRWRDSSSDTNIYVTPYMGFGGVRPYPEQPAPINFNKSGFTVISGWSFQDDATDGVWREYILKWEFPSNDSTADGAVRLYVNGTLVGSDTGFSWDSYSGQGGGTIWTSWGPYMANPFPQLCSDPDYPCGSGGDIWVDAFSVDDTWNSIVEQTQTTVRRSNIISEVFVIMFIGIVILSLLRRNFYGHA